jgi:alkaline phosphatase D
MLSRRSLLVAAPALVSGLFAAPRFAAGAGAQPFTLGVASGDPWPDGFVIWTRLAPDPIAEDGLGGLSGPQPVLWEVAEDEAMGRVVAQGRVEADARLAHSVHVEVAGLQPDRPYWYRFTAMGARSPVGKARTAPPPGQAPGRLRLVMASCSHYEVGYFSAYRHMAAEQPDLTLLLGDYIYEYSYDPARRTDLVRNHDRRSEVADLAGYRRRYALYRTDADLQALHVAAPCLVTWDDHEVQNDYGADLSQYADAAPERFRLRRAAAYQAFYEHMPVRRFPGADWADFRVHKRLRFGDLAEFTLLDNRQFRSAPACTPPQSRRARVISPACEERTAPGRSMLGGAQEQWLYEGFRQARTRWNLIGQSLLAASIRQRAPDDSFGYWTDGWDGYPATRDRMLAALRDSRLPNPVILSGDIHSFWANEMRANAADPASPIVAPEFVCTSVTADGPPAQPFAGVREENPHVRFFEAAHRGYCSLDLSRDRLDVRFRAVSDRRDPDATVSTLQAFAVEAGNPTMALA